MNSIGPLCCSDCGIVYAFLPAPPLEILGVSGDPKTIKLRNNTAEPVKVAVAMGDATDAEIAKALVADLARDLTAEREKVIRLKAYIVAMQVYSHGTDLTTATRHAELVVTGEITRKGQAEAEKFIRGQHR